MTRQSAATMFAGAVFAAALLAGCTAPGGQGGSSPEPTPTGTATTPATGSATGSPAAGSTTDASGNPVVAISGETNYKVTRDGVVATVVCNGGGDVNVDSTNARVTMTGDCRRLEIDGDVNTVTAERVQEIRIDGDTNRVDAAQVEEAEIKGTANTVELGTVNDIRLEGSDNAVSHREGSPTSEDKGSNNSMTGP